jgi:hypothetical protein
MARRCPVTRAHGPCHHQAVPAWPGYLWAPYRSARRPWAWRLSDLGSWAPCSRAAHPSTPGPRVPDPMAPGRRAPHPCAPHPWALGPAALGLRSPNPGPVDPGATFLPGRRARQRTDGNPLRVAREDPLRVRCCPGSHFRRNRRKYRRRPAGTDPPGHRAHRARPSAAVHCGWPAPRADRPPSAGYADHCPRILVGRTGPHRLASPAT